jgi:starvation-inducible DNA-binding protein
MTTKEAHRTAQVKTFPAPPKLATTTDLKPEEVKAVTEAVNPLVADAFAMYIKSKNYHWHLSGSHFRDYHKLLDQHANIYLDSIDIMAERLRRIGGTTIRSVSHVNQLQTVGDDNSEFVSPADMVRNLIADDNHIAQKMRQAIEICENNHDDATSNRLEEILDNVERYKWFLFEVSQGADNTQ